MKPQETPEKDWYKYKDLLPRKDSSSVIGSLYTVHMEAGVPYSIWVRSSSSQTNMEKEWMNLYFGWIACLVFLFHFEF